MASTTFVLRGDPAAARDVVQRVTAERGYASEVQPSGLVRISRGSMAVTLLIGALAGARFHMAFLIAYGADERGRQIVRLDRDGAGSAVKGGAIGYAKTGDEFQALTDAVGHALTAAGLFESFERS